MVTTFHPNLPPLRKITNDNHHILHTSDRLAQVAPDNPILAYRRPRNLRDLIVRAEVPSPETASTIQHGTFKCDSRCVVCQNHIRESESFSGHTLSTFYKTIGHITCNTTNVIYLISCRLCGVQYVGETKNTLKAFLRSPIHCQDQEIGHPGWSTFQPS